METNNSNISGSSLINPALVLNEVGLEGGMKVADLGCGTYGFFVFAAAKMVGEKGLSYATDIQKSVLASVDSKVRMDNISNVKTVWSDLEIVGSARKDIPDGSLDADFLINTLYQTKDYTAVCQEAARMLKSGGKMLLVEWKKTASPLGPATDRRLSPEVSRQCAESAGFVLEKNFEAGQYHYGMVFVKK